MASGSYRQVDVQCPFYIWDEPKNRAIGCEAITDLERPTRRIFKTKDAQAQHMTDYCCDKYEYCEYYRMLMEYKYAED